jgi:hypothetical protein
MQTDHGKLQKIKGKSARSLAVLPLFRKLSLAAVIMVVLTGPALSRSARAAPLVEIDSSKGVTLSARDQALTRQALSAARRGRWNDGKAAI